MKTWKPDTCECCIEEVYNGTDIVGGGEVVKKCAVHTDVPDEELYDVLLNKENRVKNGLHRVLLGHDEIKTLGLHKMTRQKDGTDVAELKDGVEYKWQFEGTGKNRVLKAEIVGATLTKNQKDAIKALVEEKHGQGRVTIL